MNNGSTAGLTLESMQRECFNLRMYGVRDGIQIDDSLPNGQCKVVEERGVKVGFICNTHDAELLREIANKKLP